VSPKYLVLALLLVAVRLCHGADHGVGKSQLPPGIAWVQGDVAAAFAKANATKMPLFLYWGAEWCPPCNQVKANIFNQQAFIERARQFVPVYLDGDSPNAQRLGAKFRVRGYPTMILFKPDGSEITRLPGEVDAARYLRVLTLGLVAARPVKALMAEALRDGHKLSADEWRLLSDYDWEGDEAQLVEDDKLASTLRALAAAVPDEFADSAVRMKLKALAVAADKSDPAADKVAGLALLGEVLGNAALCRANFDVLVNNALKMTQFLTAAPSAEHTHLSEKWVAALTLLADDSSLSRSDQLGAINSLAEVAGSDAESRSLRESVPALVREHVERARRATDNPYERHAVVSAAADALAAANLIEESDALLKAELSHSRAPYYLMLQLGGNAARRGDGPGALSWYQKAYEGTAGAATRLQWGVTYIQRIIELDPQDERRLDRAAQRVMNGLARTHDAFSGRNQKSLEKLVGKLAIWNRGGAHAGEVARIFRRMRDVCEKLPESDPQRANCEVLLASCHEMMSEACATMSGDGRHQQAVRQQQKGMQ
jgi:thioredoxin-related protein